jgi:hypothetical protein
MFNTGEFTIGVGRLIVSNYRNRKLMVYFS